MFIAVFISHLMAPETSLEGREGGRRGCGRGRREGREGKEGGRMRRKKGGGNSLTKRRIQHMSSTCG